MFAIPGILALIFFIYIRPQEVVPALAAVPLLYVFFAASLFGLAVDLRRRINRAQPAPQTLWVAGYFLWSLVTMAIFAPSTLARGSFLLFIPILLYLLVAQSLRTFRVLQLVAGLLFGASLVLAFLGAHQGQADFGCAMVDQASAGTGTSGTPDGRPCETELDCYRGDPEPGADYMCERIGLLDTTSVAGGRVRYRGVLQDPNELGLAVTLGLMLGFAFYRSRPSGARFVVVAVAVVLVAITVYYTRSRSGQLALVAGLAVYSVYKYRWKAVVLGAMFGGPLLVAITSGSGRADADSSTETRLEAWSAAIDMLRGSPILGVGAGQFTEHHMRTAHNSFLLAAAETGLVGMTLWVTVIYASLKVPVLAIRRYAGVPAARVAETWSLAVIAALVSLIIGASFLSWTTHEIFWIHIGLSGALYSAIRTHDPSFEVRVRFFELILIAVGCVVLLLLLKLYVASKGF